jgi:hypothetical protein
MVGVGGVGGAGVGGNFGRGKNGFVGKPVMLSALLSYNIVKINAGDGSSSVLGHKTSFFNKIEFLVWGNTTYLGMKDNGIIKTPMVHPFFEGKNVQNAALGARHSFVCANNQIYGFGSNTYGQLGCKGNLHNIYTEGDYKIRQLSTEDWVVKSVKSVADIGEIWDVQIDENCSYFLTTLNLIFACGINTNNRLGLKTKDLVVHKPEEVVIQDQYYTEHIRKTLGSDNDKKDNTKISITVKTSENSTILVVTSWEAQESIPQDYKSIAMDLVTPTGPTSKLDNLIPTNERLEKAPMPGEK